MSARRLAAAAPMASVQQRDDPDRGAIPRQQHAEEVERQPVRAQRRRQDGEQRQGDRVPPPHPLPRGERQQEGKQVLRPFSIQPSRHRVDDLRIEPIERGLRHRVEGLAQRVRSVIELALRPVKHYRGAQKHRHEQPRQHARAQKPDACLDRLRAGAGPDQNRQHRRASTKAKEKLAAKESATQIGAGGAGRRHPACGTRRSPAPHIRKPSASAYPRAATRWSKTNGLYTRHTNSGHCSCSVRRQLHAEQVGRPDVDRRAQ